MRCSLEELFGAVDILQEQVRVQVFLALEVGLTRLNAVLRALVDLDHCARLRLLFFIAHLHQGLVLSEGQVLEVIWVTHVSAFDLQVAFVPLSVLCRLDGAAEELLQLFR